MAPRDRKPGKDQEQEPARDAFADTVQGWGDDEDEIGWRPEIGSVVIGTVDSIDIRSTEFGQAPVVIVRTKADQRIAVWCFHTVLRNAMIRARPQVGDRIGVKRLNDEESGAYQRYRVAVESARPEQRGFDWNAAPVPDSKTNKRGQTAGDRRRAALDPDDNDLPF